MAVSFLPVYLERENVTLLFRRKKGQIISSPPTPQRPVSVPGEKKKWTFSSALVPKHWNTRATALPKDLVNLPFFLVV
jgi:hypothetical protein